MQPKKTTERSEESHPHKHPKNAIETVSRKSMKELSHNFLTFRPARKFMEFPQ